MTRPQRNRRWRAVRTPAALLTAMAVLAGSGWVAGVRVNLTPSEPVGLWRVRRGAPRRGDYIGFCAPVRKYPFLEAGSCPNGVMPFLKEIVGVPGDSIVETDQGVVIDGRRLPRSRPLPRARDGVALPRWRGRLTLPPGEYWTYGGGDPELSFDSRYFGPLPRARIRFVVRPVLTTGG